MRPKLEVGGKTRDSDDPVFRIECEDYALNNKTYRSKKEKWDKNQPRAYNLVLQHFPPELETRLTTQTEWDQVWVDRDVIGLLKMIRNIAHNHDKNKLGLMVIIDSDMELYLGFQGPNEACDDYMAIYKARVDTINSHSDLAVKHPGHMSDTFTQMVNEQVFSKDNIRDIDSEEKKKFTLKV